MRWPDFPDVTSEFEPDIPEQEDACQSELKVVGESRAVAAHQSLNEGNESWL